MSRIAFWTGPAMTAAIAVAFYGPFGFGRSFAAFIIAVFFVLPALGVVLLASFAWLVIDRSARRKAAAGSLFLAALAPALLIPALWRFGDPLRDPARYAVWATLHRRDLDAARRRDGVFLYWDSWGMAGNEDDSYLASDPTDTLSRAGAVDRWAISHRLGCRIAAVRRMERGVYLLTTSNCPIVGSSS